MTTYIAIGLPSNEVSLFAFLSDLTNNFKYCRPKCDYANGECYCILSSYLSHMGSSGEYSDASLPGKCQRTSSQASQGGPGHDQEHRKVWAPQERPRQLSE